MGQEWLSWTVTAKPDSIEGPEAITRIEQPLRNVPNPVPARSLPAPRPSGLKKPGPNLTDSLLNWVTPVRSSSGSYSHPYLRPRPYTREYTRR